MINTINIIYCLTEAWNIIILWLNSCAQVIKIFRVNYMSIIISARMQYPLVHGLIMLES